MEYVVIPLGNPGKQYENTRHNAARVLLSCINEDDRKFSIFIPESFMNESGSEIRDYLKYKNDVSPIIIYDDKDLPLGKLRISFGRGDGGHNGLASVINSLQTRDFIRIRVGIAPEVTDGKENIPPHGKGVQDYVLKKMMEEEISVLKNLAPTLNQIVETILSDGYLKAMEKFNIKTKLD